MRCGVARIDAVTRKKTASQVLSGRATMRVNAPMPGKEATGLTRYIYRYVYFPDECANIPSDDFGGWGVGNRNGFRPGQSLMPALPAHLNSSRYGIATPIHARMKRCRHPVDAISLGATTVPLDRDWAGDMRDKRNSGSASESKLFGERVRWLPQKLPRLPEPDRRGRTQCRRYRA